MNGYWAIFKIRIKTLLHYRAAAFAGVCTQLFWGVVFVMIFQAFYGDSQTKEPLSLSQTISFVWIGQALLTLLPWKIDKEIAAQVRNGNIAYELLRPVDLYGLWYFRSLALVVAPALLRALPIFLLGVFFLGLEPPVSGWATVAFIASVVSGALLSAAIATSVLTTLFWTVSGEGIERLLPSITVILSGNLVPIPLFPNFLQPILLIQPFRGIIDIPSRLYTGVIPTHQAPYYILFQLGWGVVFVLLGRWLFKRATQRFVIQGG